MRAGAYGRKLRLGAGPARKHVAYRVFAYRQPGITALGLEPHTRLLVRLCKHQTGNARRSAISKRGQLLQVRDEPITINVHAGADSSLCK